MKAKEPIVAGTVLLKHRQALEKLRHHRQHLLDDVRMCSLPGFKPSIMSDILYEEIAFIEDTPARVDEDRP
ncbi:hypothetical protein [Bradyrhizobium sp. USDA 4454]